MITLKQLMALCRRDHPSLSRPFPRMYMGMQWAVATNAYAVIAVPEMLVAYDGRFGPPAGALSKTLRGPWRAATEVSLGRLRAFLRQERDRDRLDTACVLVEGQRVDAALLLRYIRPLNGETVRLSAPRRPEECPMLRVDCDGVIVVVMGMRRPERARFRP